MNHQERRQAILEGRTAIGIELGSTRIKAVLIDQDNDPIASGNHDWENSYVDNIWTYSLEEVWQGMQASFADLLKNVKKTYDADLVTTAAIGISGMMHGYLVFDKAGKQLAPFRTWRNNITGPASEALTELFSYPVPQRWSIAHLYMSILNGEEHVKYIDYLTTLAGYIHWQLTGQKVMGVDEASGMFPIDIATKSFNEKMMAKFDEDVSPQHYPWKIKEILPTVLVAGENAGYLTAEGAKRLDPSGQFQPGVPLCPPASDGGTGMAATNSVAVRTGNVSAGTSVFAMVVLEKELSAVYPELDLVTTPAGDLVAMVHSNNCTSDYDAWIALIGEAVKALGFDLKKGTLYDVLLKSALEGDKDCGGLLAYGYISGEHITGFEEGRPLFVRSSNSNFTLANFMRTHLFTSLGALRTGLDILLEKENVVIDEMRGHGGFFKTQEVGQKVMAAATKVPVSTLETAREGGAWGIALLASYMINREEGQTLAEYLDKHVFAGQLGSRVEPDPLDVEGFNEFMKRYTAGLAIERAAVKTLS